MNSKALYLISYGLYVITSCNGEIKNGQVANTVFQISSDPVTIAVSINKNNLTNQFIRESKLFTVSVLSKDAPLSLIGNFGFKSGRDVDKFSNVNYATNGTGVAYLTEGTLAYLAAEVIDEEDAGTHTIFIGKVTEAEVLKDGVPMTYAYYHQVKKGGTPKTAPVAVPKEKGGENKMDKYVCSVCGYVYDPEAGDEEHDITPGTPFEKLPDDWVCPVCGAGKEEFEKE
ncbi:NADH-FMN oxidoreductase RutF, flavin reductase (DIM6/NTAB) family [Desulfotomaculum arcticum]|uniref:NADH-FMN oxidoreductase RutF, flavin reductase (DIM6/NTAB) family n=1 Tax=Desulfotruncus arcticus DSM 17038 TaxID=1121424 RepID=A0A1I2XYP9_9FIRM|nr:flavin reductase [Desulfotruncus arcticus]SFH18630.1 NADH-FMN oxidoreductase RutF, flavin reductase (DIM6/NTAB) family [Desulfotomaculum arcticum] [Desulfotruncus arcticus DSM 17038]